jgi:hypothetical protein
MNMATPGQPVLRARRAFWRDWLARWLRPLLNVGVAVVVGYVLATQINQQNPRLIKALIGVGVLYAAWRFPIPVSVSAFLVLFPFPFPTFYGDSNTIFIFLITAMWLAQIVLHMSPPIRRTDLDVPILILLGVFLLSFNNVENSYALGQGLIAFSLVVAGVFLYYLIVHTVRDEVTLRRMVRIISITAAISFLVAGWELAFPGRPLIKGWLVPAVTYSPWSRDVQRVGGPFSDFELYAEYCAMMFPLLVFQLVQSRGLRNRVVWSLLALANVGALLATVTRGGVLALVLGVVYLVYRLRKTLTLTQLTLALTIGAAVWLGLEFFLSNYTLSGSVLTRLMDTKMVGGLPESRTFWPKILARVWEHPWIGHGPYYEFGEYGREHLKKYMWPHNGYLYLLHIVGIFGTAAFVWMVFRLWFTTGRHCVDRLTGSSYTGSILLVWHIMLTIFIIDESKIEFLRSPTYQFFPWIVFALAMATLNVHRAGAPAGARRETTQ